MLPHTAWKEKTRKANRCKMINVSCPWTQYYFDIVRPARTKNLHGKSRYIILTASRIVQVLIAVVDAPGALKATEFSR